MNTATATYRKRKLNGRMNKSVQDPTCAQSFNKYAYCMNNPLRYVDPSGWQMVGGSTPKHYDWRDKEVPYEPRDFREGSSYMMNCNLHGASLYRPHYSGGSGYKSSSGGVYGNGDGNGGRQTPLKPGSYVMDSNGNISVVTNENYIYDDGKVYLYNEDYSKSISINYGVISSKIIEEQLYWSSATENWTHVSDVTYLSISGNNEALGVFEFMADNTDVEWSLTMIGDDNTSVLSTSHIENRELYQGFLMSNDWTIREHFHSHPFHAEPSPEDNSWAKTVSNKFPNVNCSIYHKGNYYLYYPVFVAYYPIFP